MIKAPHNKRFIRKLFYSFRFDGYMESFGIRSNIMKILQETNIEITLEIYELSYSIPKKIFKSTQTITNLNSHFCARNSFHIIGRNVYFKNQSDLNLFLLYL